MVDFTQQLDRRSTSYILGGMALTHDQIVEKSKAIKRAGSRQEAARRLIDVETHLNCIMIQIARLEQSGVIQQIYDPEIGGYRTEVAPPVDSTAIKAAIDSRFKLLNKVLPDLRSVEIRQEVSGHLDTGPQEPMSDAELANRLMYFARRQSQAEAEVVIEDKPEVSFI